MKSIPLLGQSQRNKVGCTVSESAVLLEFFSFPKLRRSSTIERVGSEGESARCLQAEVSSKTE